MNNSHFKKSNLIFAMVFISLSLIGCNSGAQQSSSDQHDEENEHEAPEIKSTLYFSSGGGVYSLDRIFAGSDIASTIDGGTIRDFIVDSKGSIIVATGIKCFGACGVYMYSDKDNKWLNLNEGNYQIDYLAIDKQDNIVGSTLKGSLLSLNKENGLWYNLDFPAIVGNVSALNIDSKGTIYVSAAMGEIYSLTRNSKQWHKLSLAVDLERTSINSMAIDNQDNVYIAANRVWKYTPNSQNWADLGFLDKTKVVDIKLDADNNLYAVTGAGFVYHLPSKQSAGWGLLNDGHAINADSVHKLAIGRQQKIVYAASDVGIWQKDANGTKFNKLAKGFSVSNDITKIVISP